MTEKQFLQELKSALTQLPQEERIDILQDIKEYFANGQADGKTDSEISAELGAPEAIAKELIDSFDVKQEDFASSINNLAEDKFDKVDIQIENGILFISPSKDGKMYTDAINKSYRQQLSVDIINRTLVITLKEEKKWGLFSFTGSMKSPTLNVQIPSKIYEKIQIATDHGNVTGDGLQCGELLVESDNGRIHFSQIKADEAELKSGNGEIELRSIVAKELRVETDNGQLKLQDVHSGNLNASSDNGAIVMKQVEGNVRAKTDNGRIHLLTDDLDRNIKLETDNGSILLETRSQPKNSTIRAELDWGKISVFGLKNRSSVFGNGDHSVDLQSDYGDITVQLAQ